MPLPRDRPSRPGSRPNTRFRVGLCPPPDFAEAANLWIDAVETDLGADFTLLFDYPDFHPGVGWRVVWAGASYDVTAVDGRKLTCTKGGGP